MPGETADRAWTKTASITLPGPDGKPTSGLINSYFVDHPEMVLGKADFADKLYEGRYSVKAWDNFDLKDALHAYELLEKGQLDGRAVIVP